MTRLQAWAAAAVKCITDLRTGESVAQTVQVVHRDPATGRIRTTSRRK